MHTDLERAVHLHGRTAFAFAALEAPERFATFASREVPGALVAYRALGRVDAVLGEPLAPLDRVADVTREFLADRRAHGRRVLGFCAPERFALAAVACGAGAVAFAAEPEIDPWSWEPIGRSAKKLRARVRRLRREGAEVVALPPRTAPEPRFRLTAERLVDAWRRALPRRAHLLALEPWRRAEEKRYFAVFDPKDGEALWSLLVAHPVYALEGWHLCHLIHHPQAPRGASELVLAGAIEALGDEGVRYATFGPVAARRAGDLRGFGPLARLALRAGYRIADRAGGHARSALFLRKLHAGPWPPRYTVVFPRRALPSAVLAMLRLSHALGAGERAISPP